jgi:hypothetical protein
MKTLVWIGSSCVVAMWPSSRVFLWIPHGAPTASTKVVNDSAESLTLISVEYHTCGNTGSVRTNGLESGQSRRFVYHVCGEGGYTVVAVFTDGRELRSGEQYVEVGDATAVHVTRDRVITH